MTKSRILKLKSIGIYLLLIGIVFTVDGLVNVDGRAGLVAAGILSLLLYANGIKSNDKAQLLLSGFALGFLPGLGLIGIKENWDLIGKYVLIGIGSGFLLAVIGFMLIEKHIKWWVGFVGCTFLLTGVMIAPNLEILDLMVAISLSGGISMLVWGIGQRVLGLIISGSIVTSLALGFNQAWMQPVNPTGLAGVAVLMMWFALGWGMIVIFSRLVFSRFVWWPLIPGGIMAVMGWGLYSGANPNAALNFIGNTGSVAILIFGLYILLMRKGIKR